MIELTIIAQTVAIVSACWAIASGISAWKREFIGKRRIELAEQVIAKFFEVRDAIAYVRNPFTLPGEGEPQQKDSSGLGEATDDYLQQRVVYERHSKKESTFAEFQVLKYRFMAAFGPQTELLFSDTHKALHSVFVSAHMLCRHYWKRQGRVQMEGIVLERHLKEMEEQEAILWDRCSEDDGIRKQLQEIQIKFEVATAECFQEPVSSLKKATRASWKWLTAFFSEP